MHEGEEGGIVLSGRLEVTVDGERRILGPVTPIILKVAAPHSFPVRWPRSRPVVSACTPPTF